MEKFTKNISDSFSGKFESAEESWIHAMKLAAQIKDFNNAGKQAVEIGNLHLEQVSKSPQT